MFAILHSKPATPTAARGTIKTILEMQTRNKVVVTLDAGRRREVVVSGYPIDSTKSFEVDFSPGVSTTTVRLAMTSLPGATPNINSFEAIQSVEVYETTGGFCLLMCSKFRQLEKPEWLP